MTTPVAESSSPPAGNRAVITGLVVWLALAAFITASGVPQKLTPPVPQVLIVAITAALIVSSRVYSPLRAWTRSIDWRGLVGLHLFRAVAGAGFLWAASRGTLPQQFAEMAGYGDIVVAVLAFAVILFVSPNKSSAPRVYALWNTIGLIDIMLVVVSAARAAIANPSSMAQLMQPPFALLPLFYVPLVIASHLWLYGRLMERMRSR